MDNTRLYVGGFPYSTTESELEALISDHGNIESLRIITDRDTGRSRGFGFVEMGSSEECAAAIEALNGMEFGGRSLIVSEAKPRNQSGGGGRSYGGSSRY